MAVYKAWYEFKDNFPKKSRPLGSKIDECFLGTLELFFIASHLNKEEKLPYLKKAGMKLDLLKAFLQVAWELKVLDNKKHITISEQLSEIGKMLGGWIRGVEKTNSPR